MVGLSRMLLVKMASGGNGSGIVGNDGGGGNGGGGSIGLKVEQTKLLLSVVCSIPTLPLVC